MLQLHPQGAVLRLHIQPGASRTEIVSEYAGSLKIRVQAPPVDGKANKALFAFLANVFEIPRSRMLLLKGETGRKKSVLLTGMDLAEARAILAPYLAG